MIFTNFTIFFDFECGLGTVRSHIIVKLTDFLTPIYDRKTSTRPFDTVNRSRFSKGDSFEPIEPIWGDRSVQKQNTPGWGHNTIHDILRFLGLAQSLPKGREAPIWHIGSRRVKKQISMFEPGLSSGI